MTMGTTEARGIIAMPRATLESNLPQVGPDSTAGSVSLKG